jgi:hypothetical protein
LSFHNIHIWLTRTINPSCPIVRMAKMDIIFRGTKGLPPQMSDKGLSIVVLL